MLQGMSFDVKFDRNINRTRHHISPGGYELNHKRFDFHNFEGFITDDTMECLVTEYDDSYSPQDITANDLEGLFQEFFIFTGELNDFEINPKEISNISFLIDGKWIKARKKLEVSANETLAYNHRKTPQ